MMLSKSARQHSCGLILITTNSDGYCQRHMKASKNQTKTLSASNFLWIFSLALLSSSLSVCLKATILCKKSTQECKSLKISQHQPSFKPANQKSTFSEQFLQLFALSPGVLCQLGSSPAAFEHLNLCITENEKEITFLLRNPLKQNECIICIMISSYS